MIPLNPVAIFSRIYTWFDFQAGFHNASIQIFFPEFGFFLVFKLLGFSLPAIERLYFYAVYTVAGLGMYYLASSIFPGKNTRMISFIAAIFYMFNPYVFIVTQAYLPYAVLPLILGLYIKGLTSKTINLKYPFLISLALFGILIDLPQYKMLFVTFAVVILYSLFYVFLFKGSKKKCATFLCMTIGVCFAMSMFIIVTFYSMLISNVEVILQGVPIFFPDTNYALMNEIFRLLGGMGFYEGWKAFAHIYATNSLIILVGYFIPIIAFSALILKPKDKNVLFLAVLSLVSIAAAVGPNPPFGEFYKLAVINIPFLAAFRTSCSLNIGTTMGFSVLIGFATAAMYIRLNNKIQKSNVHMFRKIQKGHILVVVIIALILINAWSIVIGIDGQPPLARTKIPQSYYDADTYLNEQSGDFRVFILPQRGGYETTNWGYAGANLIPFIFSRPVIDGEPYGGGSYTLQSSFISSVYANFYEGETSDLSKILGLLNVKYILFEGYYKDLDHSGNWYIDKLNTEKAIYPTKKFGELTIYENENLLPIIYTSHEGIETSNSSYIFSLSPILDFTSRSDTMIINTDVSCYPNLFNLENGAYLYIPDPAGRNAYVITEPKGRMPFVFVDVTQPFNITFFELENETVWTRTGQWIEGWNLGATGARIFTTDIETPAQINASIHISQPGSYKVFLHYEAQWNRGIGNFYVDDVLRKRFDEYSSQIEQGFIDLGTYNFDAGFHTFKLEASGLKRDVATDYVLEGDYISIAPMNTSADGKLIDMNNFKSKFLYLKEDPSNITYEKINPTRYMVNIKNATQPFFLVFSTSFNPNWEATYTINNEIINPHFLANGYANAWYINKTGTYTITLEFWPQKLFYIGSAISITTLILCILYISKNKIKTIYKRYIKKRNSQSR